MSLRSKLEVGRCGVPDKGNVRLKSSKGYPYRIIAFRDAPAKNLQPIRVNEFLMIEAILRSEETISRYRESFSQLGALGGRKALVDILKRYGIVGHDPLKATHHVLLKAKASSPRNENKWNKKMASLGHLGGNSKILDMGVLAKLPPHFSISDDMGTLYGPVSGEADCLAYLKSNNPRFLCLRLDTSYAPSAIIDDLRALLQARHKQFKHARFTGPFSHLYEMQQPRIRDIQAWLQYLHCYDLQKKGHSIDDIADQVFPESRDSVARTNQGLQSVRNMIKAVQRTGWLPLKVR